MRTTDRLSLEHPQCRGTSPPRFGLAASAPSAWRTLEAIDAEALGPGRGSSGCVGGR